MKLGELAKGCLASAIALIFASPVMADRVKLSGGAYQYSNGGEFTVTDFDDSPGTGADYDKPGITGLAHDLASKPGTFQTFCVEHNENISFGTAYYFDIQPSAKNGGVSGGDPDPLSYATKYLYYNFRKDSLAGYDDGGTVSSDAARLADAHSLQDAIWVLEGEIVSTGDSQANTWITLALLKQAGTHESKIEDGVAVLRLWGAESSSGAFSVPQQDQLTMVETEGGLGVPLPTVAIGSLGFGALALMGRIRAPRRRKA